MSECTDITTDKRRSLKENKRKFTFNNPAQIEMAITKVDGCKYTDSLMERCDYEARIAGTEYYIELKGKNVPKGISQLESTIKLMSADVKSAPKKAYVVCTRSAPAAQPSILTARARFKRAYNSSLSITTIQHEEKVS